MTPSRRFKGNDGVIHDEDCYFDLDHTYMGTMRVTDERNVTCLECLTLMQRNEVTAQ